MTVFKWIGIGVGLLFGLVMCSALVTGGDTQSTSSTPSRAATPPVAEAQPAAEAAQSGPATSFEDGGYEAGTDIAPGKYRSDGDTGLCWGQVRGGVDKEFNITKDKLISGDGQQTVTLKGGQYIESQGCGTWTKVG